MFGPACMETPFSTRGVYISPTRLFSSFLSPCRSGSLRPGSLEDGGGGAAAASLSSNMTPSGSVNHHPAAADDNSGEYRYELRGVVAHVGTADSGHYYSFIRSD